MKILENLGLFTVIFDCGFFLGYVAPRGKDLTSLFICMCIAAIGFLITDYAKKSEIKRK